MLRADFLIIHLPYSIQRIFLFIGYLLGAVFFLMIITGGWEESVLSYIEDEFEGEGALRVPSWPARWMVMIGSALALINYIVLAYIDVFKPKSLVRIMKYLSLTSINDTGLVACLKLILLSCLSFVSSF